MKHKFRSRTFLNGSKSAWLGARACGPAGAMNPMTTGIEMEKEKPKNYFCTAMRVLIQPLWEDEEDLMTPLPSQTGLFHLPCTASGSYKGPLKHA